MNILPAHSRTLIDVLRFRAAHQMNQPAYIFLADGESREICLTYGELDQRARAIAAALQDRGAVGERVLLLYPYGLEYIAAFFGCLYAGAVAVPAYPPDLARQRPSLARIRVIAQNAQAALALTTSAILSKIESILQQDQDFRFIAVLATDTLSLKIALAWQPFEAMRGTLALLQYTSGSTTAPKGVMVTHGNLISNHQMIQAALQHPARVPYVSWLPLFHDMGLIGNVLQALYVDAPCVLMPPTAFLQKPVRWLQAISQYRAHTSGGPNFAYDLCVRRIAAEERDMLDLSCWKCAFNGSEPIRWEPLQAFIDAFAPCHFRLEAFYPVYGLAEATAFVSGGPKSAPPVIFDAEGVGTVFHHMAKSHAGAKIGAFVGCGHGWLDEKILIVDPENRAPCLEEHIGEIWLSGPHVAQGYWNNQEATEQTFGAYLQTGEGPFLRTGDLGFVREGELFVTGRIKDLIIMRGLNYYPQDIEKTVEQCHPTLRTLACVVFAVPVQHEERLVVVQEVERHASRKDWEEAIVQIRQQISSVHGLLTYAIVLIKHGSMPKTTSGKLQHAQTRSRFLEGTLDVVYQSIADETEPSEARSKEMSLMGQMLRSMPEEGRQQFVSVYLQTQIARVANVRSAAIDWQQPITAFGLDSLKSVELKNQIEAELDVLLPLETLFQDNTLAHLAETIVLLCSRELHAQAETALTVQSSQDLCGIYPLSSMQGGLWFLNRLRPASTEYHLAFSIRLSGVLNLALLEQSLNDIVRRHAILRAVIVEEDGKPMMQIKPYIAFRLPIEACPFAGGRECEEAARRRAHVEARKPYDLVTGPLFRLQLLQVKEDVHVLLLNVHHIVFDGWSFGVFLRELTSLYTGYTKEQDCALPPLPTHYGAYVSWQRQWLGSEEYTEQLAYWRKQLANVPAVLHLPLDHPRPAQRSLHGARHSFEIPLALCERLKQFSQQEQTTLFTLLLAAFQVLLFRYSCQQDIVVGTPVAGRRQAALKDVIGFFVNTLAIRTDFAGITDFATLLRRVKATLLAAYAHADVPFDAVVEAIQPARDLSYTPVFQASFAMQNVPLPVLQAGEVTLVPTEVTTGSAPFDISLAMLETSTTLLGHIDYNTDIFEPETMQRFTQHFQILLRDIVIHPHKRITDLSLLTRAEQEQLLSQWNQTEQAYPRAQSVSAMFEEQAKAARDRIAVVADEMQLSYGELNARANQLAHYLQHRGIEPQMVVGVCLERSIHLVIGLVALLKRGAIYLPLDPATPQERLTLLLQDAHVAALITSQQIHARLPPSRLCTICLDRDQPLLAQQHCDNPQTSSTIDQAAYVIYTSGSTGTPKGVVVTERSLLNLCQWYISYSQISLDTVMLLALRTTFDASIKNIVTPLLCGGQAVLAPEGYYDATAMLEIIERHAVSVLNVTPAMFSAVLDVASTNQFQRLASLAYVHLGGEALRRAVLASWLKSGACTCTITNIYGPTECCDISTCYTLDHEQTIIEEVVPIGRPIDNAQIYVLNERLQLTPRGVPGELYIGGCGVAQGYLNYADLTAGSFLPHPFSAQPGARLYKTGDLVRYRADGTLEFLGRVDQQVKIRGFRIEPGEIEAALRRHPEVQEAVVIACEERAGDKRLVAYVVAAQGASPSKEVLSAFLHEQLPSYMVPTQLMLLDALPLTPNGKLDRRALPLPESLPALLQNDFTAPRNPAEEVLATIWTQVLEVEQVGVHDNFFALGGHSLLATQVIFRIHQALQRDLSLRQLFEHPTVAGLARCLQTAEVAARPPLIACEREHMPPLSFAQQRLWFLDQLTPGNPFYNMPLALHLKGDLKLAALAQSFEQVIDRHEALRTTFILHEGRPMQHISPCWSVALPLVDLSQMAQTEQGRLVKTLTQEEATRPFDLTTGPLLRLWVLRLGQQEHLLLLTLHHIICDGWSLGVLLRELLGLYTSLSVGQSLSLPALPLQYADYVCWQRQWMQGEALQRCLTYWRQHLAGAPRVLELPTDHPRPARQSYRGALSQFSLSAPLSQKLNEFSRQQNVTLFMTLLAAFATLLARYSGQHDLVIGTPIANRAHVDLEGLIGFFVNALALRLTLSKQDTFESLLEHVRELALNAYDHQDLPFEQLVEALQLERDVSHSPLFQVLFALQNVPLPAFEMPGLELQVHEVDWHAAKFDLSLLMRESEGQLMGTFEYNTDLFEKATIERLIVHWQTLLEAIVNNRQQPLAHLSFLTEKERHLLLKEWNATQEAYPSALCVHQLFEVQVARTPEAIALVCGEEQMSYRELNRRANQLAHYLRSLGVGPDHCVGLCLGRTSDLIVATLGILKAGGAYVPLDQTCPIERLALMLTDAQIKLVITYRQFAPFFSEQRAVLRLLCLDEEHEVIALQEQEAPHVLRSSSSLCYIVHTSGSTGAPKSVCMPHRPLVNLVYWQLRRGSFPPLKRTIQFSSLLFDPLFQEVFCTFAEGGTLVLISEAIKRDPASLLLTMEREQIEQIYLPFIALQQIAEFAQSAGKTLPCLREIFTAGEQLQMTPELRAWLERMPQCRLYNYYGPSETHVVTAFRLSNDASTWTPLPPIGVPIANTQLYVLDEAFSPVPIGVVGELYIGGDAVGRGYAGRPHLTAERFLPNPFSDRAGSLLYKTGDRVRYLPDGNLEFLGRLDSQIKIRGYRVELGEVELHLQQHPQVKECAVVVQGRGGEKRLLAYVVADTNDPELETALSAYLKTRLPEYMLPVAYLLIDCLPVTATGKVNRQSLLEMAPEKVVIHSNNRSLVAPRTPLEQELLDIWSELLHVAEISIHDNFFAIGGQSLLATRMMVCIRERIQPDFSLQTIFEAPTISALSEVIVRQELASADSELLLQLMDQLA